MDINARCFDFVEGHSFDLKLTGHNWFVNKNQSDLKIVSCYGNGELNGQIVAVFVGRDNVRSYCKLKAG